MSAIKVIIHGAAGRVGQSLMSGLVNEPGIKLVGALDLKVPADQIKLVDGSVIPFSSNLSKIIDSTQPKVMVDFTIATAVMPAVRTAAKRGVHVVIGTTGLTVKDIAEIEEVTKENNVGAVVASNFALGAVLMMHFAKMASKYFDYAEIMELHHHLKADAPSGTALNTAKGMASARSKPFLRTPDSSKNYPSRGQNVEGVNIHSVRLPGLMAHQEVMFGGPGQTLSIRQDTINRDCYVPGVALAIKEVVKRKGLTQGLDSLIGF